MQRRGCKDPASARITHFTTAAYQDDILAAEEAEFLTSLGADAGEEGGEAIVVALAQVLVRMMMALGALEPNAQEQLRSFLGQLLRIMRDPIIVGGAVAECRSLGSDQLAHELL